MEKLATEADGKALRPDLKKLLVSRMLIQANSGGGKSHTIRKLCEILHGQVQQFIIDTEGEFVSLREKFDYVYVAAQGGDALAHPKTAKLLAERLLETGVSAIIDIYELKPHERHAFVRIFLDAMVNAPKTLWHPVVVVLDEAHVYAPETDKSEALGAVADIATRGRKRGFCLVAATQRISKLSKDVAAELNNKLIGRTSLDVDAKRAAAEIGMNPKDALPLLRGLDPEKGQFYAFGPAIGHIPRLVSIAAVETHHQKSGEKYRAPPKPTDAILAVLPKLADLPKESEEKAKTEADLRRELAETRRELTTLKNARPIETVKLKDASKESLAFEFGRGRTEGFAAGFAEGDAKGRSAVLKKIESVGKDLRGNLSKALARYIDNESKTTFDAFFTAASIEAGRASEAPKQFKYITKVVAPLPVPPLAHQQIGVKPYDSDPPRRREGSPITSAPQQRILDALAWFKDKGIEKPVKQAVGAVAGASPKSSAFSNNLGTLRSAGLIDYDGKGGVFLTLAGEAESVAPRDSRSLIECWKSIVTGPQAKILEVLREDHPSQVAKPGLAERAGASVSSSAFSNNLGALRMLGAIDYPTSGFVALTKHAMQE